MVLKELPIGVKHFAREIYYQPNWLEEPNNGQFLSRADFLNAAELSIQLQSTGTYAFNQLCYFFAEDEDAVIQDQLRFELLNPVNKLRPRVLLGTQAVYETLQQIYAGEVWPLGYGNKSLLVLEAVFDITNTDEPDKAIDHN